MATTVRNQYNNAKEYSESYYTTRNIALGACFSICFVTYVCCGFLMVLLLSIDYTYHYQYHY